MSKKQNILDDLKQGLEVNMLNDIPRYGTAARSRIAEFRAEGLAIESVVVDRKSNALAYIMPEYVKARSEIQKHMKDTSYSKLSFGNVSTVYLDFDNSFNYKDLDMLEVSRLLKEGYILIPF